MNQTITASVSGAVTTVTLNRPHSGNAIDIPMAQALREQVESAALRGSRVLLLEAAGEVFCAGGDLGAMAEAGDPDTFLAELAGEMHEVLERLAAAPYIVIAAVDGAAAGAGFGLALNADLIIATERSRFLTAYASVGLTPDSGVSTLLAKSVGLHRALYLATTGHALDAAEALSWGIVAEVVAAGSLATRSRELAEQLAAVPGRALAETKRLIRSELQETYAAHLQDEQRSIANAVGDPQTQAAIAEFARRNAERKLREQA